MNNATIDAVRAELENTLIGRRCGKIVPLGRRRFAIDLRLPNSQYLFIAPEPGEPRIYLVRRRLKDLERVSENPQPFHMLLKKHLSGSTLVSLQKITAERVLLFNFAGSNDMGEAASHTLVVHLTGRSSNVFLLDASCRVISSLIEKDTDGQRVAEEYSPPVRIERMTEQLKTDVKLDKNDNGSISAALDRIHIQKEVVEQFRSRADAARRNLEREAGKRRKLLGRLRSDLQAHGDAEQWKRYGDLILANLSTAKRRGDRIVVTDYFDESEPEIEIEVDENLSLTDAAQKYFKRYTKAHNAACEIGRRILAVEAELAYVELQRQQLAKAIAEGSDEFLAEPGEAKNKKRELRDKKRFTGARQFASSDGFEILVGKKATDNDHLTFRVAGSLDLWLHAADYSGSHVVVRNPNRKDIPQRTLLEAAQLAAFYSSGKSQPKAAVNYTQKKFVIKPKGAAPGLVRLASFKTILVRPVVPPAIDKTTR